MNFKVILYQLIKFVVFEFLYFLLFVPFYLKVFTFIIVEVIQFVLELFKYFINHFISLNQNQKIHYPIPFKLKLAIQVVQIHQNCYQIQNYLKMVQSIEVPIVVHQTNQNCLKEVIVRCHQHLQNSFQIKFLAILLPL